MSRPLIVLMFVLGAGLATIVLMIGDVQIRTGGTFNFARRGLQTNSAQPLARIAPKQTIEATVMQAEGVRPANPSGSASIGSGIAVKAGIIDGIFGGLVGAGLIGMVLGYGVAGGLVNLASVFGLVLQAGLVAAVSLRFWMWWQRRQEFATAGGPPLAGIDDPTASNTGATAGEVVRNFGRGLAEAMTGGSVKLNKFDYDDFERLLGEVLHAYGAQDLSIVRSRVTPELLNRFSEQIERNASRGVVNKVSDVRLLKGELAESWSEGDQDFATVTMHYSMVNAAIDRATGKVVEGSMSPMDVSEKWTFARNRYGAWRLFAMQHD